MKIMKFDIQIEINLLFKNMFFQSAAEYESVYGQKFECLDQEFGKITRLNFIETFWYQIYPFLFNRRFQQLHFRRIH